MNLRKKWGILCHGGFHSNKQTGRVIRYANGDLRTIPL